VKVWGRRSAYNVQKVLWALGELGLAHEHVEAGGTAGGLERPEFLALNPHGRIPVLADGDAVVWESNTIVRYLAARHGAGSLWRDDSFERSRYERWMDWELATFQPDFMALFWGFFRTPEAKRDPAAVAHAARRCSADVAKLDAQLASSPFLAGERLSPADIAAGTALYRYFEMGLEVPSPRHVRDWYARLAARPAYREHVMRPFEELRGRLAF
jgi:glutathione S-transferase